MKYEVLLVKYPFTDGSDYKVRPVLVLARASQEDTVVCKITSNHRPENAYEIKISEHQDATITASYAHLNTIFTVHKSLVIKSLGRITDNTFQSQVNTILKQLFKLS